MLPLMAAGLGLSGAGALGSILGSLRKDNTGKRYLKYLMGQQNKSIGLLNQVGLTAQDQINQNYMDQLGHLSQNLTNRGLTNSSAATTMAAGLDRQRQQALTSAREGIAMDKAGVMGRNALSYSQLATQVAQANKPDYSGIPAAFQGIGSTLGAMNQQNQYSQLMALLGGGSPA